MIKKSIAIWIILLFLLSSLIPITSSNSPTLNKTIYVDDDNTEGPWDGTIEHPYKHIQDGINVAQDGDTIVVYSGCYYENVVIKKSIHLCGSGWEHTIIDGNSEGHVISIYHDNVTITNFTVKNCGEISAVIRIDNCNNVTISYNFLTSIERYTAIDAHPSNISSLSGISIHGNIINNMTRGILFSCCCYSYIENNLIENTIYGIFLGGYGMYNNTVSKNIIRNCSDGIFLYSYENERNVITHNNILNCSTGIGLEGNCNIIKLNEFIGNEYGIYVCLGRNNEIHFNNFIQNNKSAYFHRRIFDIYLNCWNRNYWDDHNSILPKIISGRIEYGYRKYIPWINFDWHPAKEPYDIS
jgi:nitrous oxidase accessory protein NosD